MPGPRLCLRFTQFLAGSEVTSHLIKTFELSWGEKFVCESKTYYSVARKKNTYEFMKMKGLKISNVLQRFSSSSSKPTSELNSAFGAFFDWRVRWGHLKESQPLGFGMPLRAPRWNDMTKDAPAPLQNFVSIFVPQCWKIEITSLGLRDWPSIYYN